MKKTPKKIKNIKISEESHTILKNYCEQNGLKIYGFLENIIKEELLNEVTYSKFKNEVKFRTKNEQLHKAIREVKRKLSEIDRIVEYTSRMKQELSEGEEGIKYWKATSKNVATISEMVNQLNNKIKKLDDAVIVYPAHGPGSSCGKNLGKETFSTIGEQKKMNYALKEMNREEFIKEITSGLSAPPAYFPLNAQINKKGYSSLDEIMNRNLKSLSVDEFENEIKNKALVLDTRNPEEFENGFVKGAINIGLNGRFAEWVGTLININQPLLIVAEEGKEEESILRLARVGYENVKGYLKGGYNSWMTAGKSLDMVLTIDAEEFELDMKHEKDIVVVDVRKESEYDAGHIENAENCVLQNFDTSISDLNFSDRLYVHCQAGYRSMIAASILKRKGFDKVKNIKGGYLEIVKQGIPVEISQPELN